jgi:hypothetical protein
VMLPVAHWLFEIACQQSVTKRGTIRLAGRSAHPTLRTTFFAGHRLTRLHKISIITIRPPL